ncbi:hypothetical protein [Pseudomonas fluorescens]|uniref:Uncharacterized protein n=1 Tax=Pseudomonas fluorescens TaxID=294 RepID=A0A0D0NM51_PSEFL|nr:hypothetical protein [Pseudomonas fluorescens]KIQ60181.1 hypothetical protein RL74_06720 [Pseudomonas fluorescens]
MPKHYEVLERSFINGRLYEVGDTVTLEIDSPGGNLKLAEGKAAAQDKPAKQSGKAAAQDKDGNLPDA